MPQESLVQKKARAKKIITSLQKLYPDVKCFLDHKNPFELLVAVILSAQCTDKRVNLTTPKLFARLSSPEAMASCKIEDLEELIRSTGFYKNKAKNLKAMAQVLVSKHKSQVPGTMEELSSLPGVGRKTANVILGEIFKIPSMVVDTHVTRLSNRLDLARGEDAVKLEQILMGVVEKKHWTPFSHWLISHGRTICPARKPLCAECILAKFCPKRGVS